MTAREALRLGTMGGARCLGRQREIGSLEAGKLADLVMWRLDGLGHDGIDDKVAALVFGPPAPVELALVGGRPVVERGELVERGRRGADPPGPPRTPPAGQGAPLSGVDMAVCPIPGSDSTGKRPL